MKYRKKPVIIDAYQWFPELAEMPGVRKIPAHSIDYQKGKTPTIPRGIIHEAPDQYVVDTLEGPLHVTAGDFIIKGVKGEYYPCKPDIFALTYEEVV